MLRVGTHYLEPRRILFFVTEGVLVWTTFVIVAEAMTLWLVGEHRSSWLVEGLWVTAAAELGMYFTDLHDLRTALSDAAQGHRIYRALGLAVILGGLLIIFGREHLAPALVAGTGAAALTSLGLRAGLPFLGRRLGLQLRLYLVGGGHAAQRLLRELERDSDAEIAGFAGFRTRGIAERARLSGATTIVVATDERRGLPTHELLRCRAAGLEVIDAATLAARVLHRLPVELIRPGDLIFGDGFARPTWLLLGHRLLSITVAVILLTLAFPVILFAALAIRLDSPGSILYRQTRAGKGGIPFGILKFRTMRENAEAGKAHWATRDDPRVTRVGRVLRRYRIDELPQLWNVLRGDMDLVGPRPERPEFVAELRRRIPYYDLRHLVCPGITGYAQVRYPYAASVEEAREKLQYDLYYVRHLSLGLDLLVLALTAKVVLFGRGAR